jgi:K+-sensing histidine kinase KdpD
MSATRDPDQDGGGPESPEQERRGGYLGFVAHEVRNPLSTALWSAELLARMAAAERGGARGEKLTAMCLRSLARVRQLVEDHFLCERLDVGGIPLRPEALSAREVLDDLVGRLAPEAKVSIVVDPAFTVRADRNLLERALDALLASSGRENTPVRVEARGDGDMGALVFTGNRAASEALEDPRKGSTGDSKGRALSVAVARRVAAALGGSLGVEDGRFVLSLPLAEAYTARPDPAAHP